MQFRYLNGLLKYGLNKLNYTYFIIDEPCFIGRAADGTLLENKTTWPTGLKAFGAELRLHGMKLGIYTCVGPKTCGGCVASEGHEDHDMQTFADWGAEYVKVDSCSRNCTVAAGVSGNTSTCGRELWSRFTSAIAKTGKDMVYSIIGNCDPARGEQPWKWGKETAHSWRTNIDAQVGWQAVPYLIDCQRRMSGNGSWCNANGKHWVGGKEVTSTPGDGGRPCACSAGHQPGACLVPAPHPLGGPQQFAGNDGGKGGHWNDMDMVMIGSRSYLFEYRVNKTTGKVISKGAGPGGSALTVTQSRVQLSMWAIMKSPILMSADLNLVSTWAADPAAPEKGSGPELIQVLQNAEVLAVSDDPLGMESIRLEDHSGGKTASSPDVYVGEMVHGKFAAVLFNRGGPKNMTLALPDLTIVNPAASAASYTIRDLWSHTDNGTVAAGGSLTVMVGDTDVVMITLTPVA